MSKIDQSTKKLIIEMYQQGTSIENIRKKVSIRLQTVREIIKEAGIEIRGPKKKLAEGDKEKMGRLYQEGWSMPKIAAKFQVADSLVLRYLKEQNIERRSAEEAHRKYPINENFFDVIDTEEKAYFLGFLYADGYNCKEGNYTRLALEETDREILEKLTALIYKENPIERIKVSDRTEEGKGITNYFDICSKHICGQLDKLGCPQAKTFDLVWPEWLPDKLERHFIRGYFDGDGGLNINTKKGSSSTIKMTSTKQFSNKIKDIIVKELDISMCIYKSTTSEVYDVCTSGDRQVAKICKWMYDGANIYMARKYNLYQGLLIEIEKTDALIRAGTQGYSKRYLNR